MLSFGFFEILLSFILVLTPIVFIHELGHFWVARKTGVIVDVFSVGFGREIFGWTDSHGTRWRFAWIPLGGYVKMRGDENIVSGGSTNARILEGSFSNAPLFTLPLVGSITLITLPSFICISCSAIFNLL